MRKTKKIKHLAIIIFCLFIFYSCSFTRMIKEKRKEKLISTEQYLKFDINDERIYIDVIFDNDVKGKMGIDLGAGTCFAFKNSGIEHIDTLKPVLKFGKTYSADGKVTNNYYYKVGDIRTNAFQLKNSLMPVVISSISKCNKINGILGSDIFDDKILEINFTDSSIMVHDNLPALTNWQKVDIHYEYPHFFIILTNDGNRTKFLLDTGYSGSLLLSTHKSDEKSIRSLVREDTKELWIGSAFSSATGRTGYDTTAYFISKPFIIGENNFDKEVIIVSKTIKKNIIGMRILKNMNILLDFNEGNMYVGKLAKSNETDEYDLLKNKGFSIGIIDNKIMITALKINAPAIKNGLRIGDEVLQVNNIKIDGELCEIINNIKKTYDNNTIIVVKRDNNLIDIKL